MPARSARVVTRCAPAAVSRQPPSANTASYFPTQSDLAAVTLLAPSLVADPSHALPVAATMRRSTVMLWHSLRFMNAGAAAPMAAASLQLLQSSSMHAFHALCQEPRKQQPICNAAAVPVTCSRTTSTTPSSTLARQLHSCKHGSCAKAGPRNMWAYSSSASSDDSSSPASNERQQTGPDASTSSGLQPLARCDCCSTGPGWNVSCFVLYSHTQSHTYARRRVAYSFTVWQQRDRKRKSAITWCYGICIQHITPHSP